MKITDIKIPGNDYGLAATMFYPGKVKQKIPAVLFFHGMISQRKPRTNGRAQALAEKGIAALTFDFRGCGETPGDVRKTTYRQWFEDALLAYDFLISQDSIDQDRIGVCGKSFGGYMAALTSQRRMVKSMVVHAPATYNDSGFDHPYNFDTKARYEFRISRKALYTMPIRAIEAYLNPFLVVGSQFDNLCPSSLVEGYYNHAASKQKKLVWIKGADHPLSRAEWNQEYIDLLIDWFTKTL